jgi:hypothetical protein
MSSKDKKMVPIRVYPDKYQKLTDKLKEAGLSLQKFTEVLIDAYLKNNKEIMRLVGQRVEDKKNKKNSNELDDEEREEVFRVIEKEYSPLREVNEAIEEIDDEDQI